MASVYVLVFECKYESQLQIPHPMISQALECILCIISPRDLLPLTLPSLLLQVPG